MKKFFSQLLANVRDRRKSGFTLIELLIVIGILGILVVAVLLTLNPAEAQKKTRDAKRMKDLGTLQSALQQYLDGGGTAVAGTWTSPIGAYSTANSTCVGTGWITLGTGNSLCSYITTLPNDPAAGASRTCAGTLATGGGCNSGGTAQNMVYRVGMNVNGQFEVDVRQESQSNLAKVQNDGGDADSWAEAFNDVNTVIVGN